MRSLSSSHWGSRTPRKCGNGPSRYGPASRVTGPGSAWAGRHANDVMNIDIVADGTRLTMAVEIKMVSPPPDTDVERPPTLRADGRPLPHQTENVQSR